MELSYVDEEGRDGWTFVWEVPAQDLTMHLMVIASNRAGTAQSVINLSHEEPKAGFGLIDFEGKVTRLQTGPATRQVRMAPGAGRWLEVRDAVQGQVNNVCEVFLAWAGGAQKLATVTFGDSFETPAWSPLGKQVLLSFATRFPADVPGAFRSRYLTYVLEEKGAR